MGLGVVLAFVAVIFEAYEHGVLQKVTGTVAVALISLGSLLAMVGGLMRPAQRWMFLHGLPAGRMRDAVLSRSMLRWWHGVGPDGQAAHD